MAKMNFEQEFCNDKGDKFMITKISTLQKLFLYHEDFVSGKSFVLFYNDFEQL